VSQPVKIGLFSGSFDPIHLGHLVMAREAHWRLGLDRTLVTPTAVPPHKPREALTPYAHRLRMVELALSDVPELEPADLEGGREVSYTVETLARVRERFPSPLELFLILGEDSLAELADWRDPEEIVRLARLAVYARPGWTTDGVQWPFVLIEGPLIGLSSSEIRRRMAEGDPVQFFLPEAVREYAERHRLYAGGGPDVDRRTDRGGGVG